MLTWLRLPAVCLECSWRFPWVSAHPALRRWLPRGETGPQSRGGEEVAPLGGNPGPAHAAGGKRSRGPGGAVRGPGRDAGSRQAVACLKEEDLGAWVGLAFSGSEPRESAAGMVLEKVQARGAFGIGRICVWKVFTECSNPEGSPVGVQGTWQDTLEIVSNFMVSFFPPEVGIP